MTRTRLLCALGLIGLMALVAASPAAAELTGENQPLLPDTGNIRGTVTDVNGVPIEHLEVCGMTESTQPVGLRYCTRTEEGGQYLIVNVPEGNFLVNAQAPWYLGEEPVGKENYPQVWYPAGKHPSEATPVPVTGEHTTTGIDFQAHHGGVITGTVTDKVTGAPISSVEVCPTWVGVPQRGEEHSCGFTDAAGHYTIRDVDTDEYTVKFDTRLIQGYEDDYYPTAVAVIAGQVTAGIDEQLMTESAPTPAGGTPPSGSGPAQGSSPGSSPTSSPGTLPPLARPQLNCRHGRHKAMRQGQLRCVRFKGAGSKHHPDRGLVSLARRVR